MYNKNLFRQVHIDQLSKQLAINLVQKPKISGMMFIEHGYIEGPVINNQIDYLVMLHELGHAHHGHTQGRPPNTNSKWYFENGPLRSEAEAWHWALQTIEEPIEDNSRRFMWDFCLASYYNEYKKAAGKATRLYNGDRFHHSFTYDEPDDYFAAVVKEIQGNLKDFKVPFKWYGVDTH